MVVCPLYFIWGLNLKSSRATDLRLAGCCFFFSLYVFPLALFPCCYYETLYPYSCIFIFIYLPDAFQSYSGDLQNISFTMIAGKRVQVVLDRSQSSRPDLSSITSAPDGIMKTRAIAIATFTRRGMEYNQIKEFEIELKYHQNQSLHLCTPCHAGTYPQGKQNKSQITRPRSFVVVGHCQDQVTEKGKGEQRVKERKENEK